MRKSCLTFLTVAVGILLLMAAPACKSVKLSDADDTLARGEYFDASKMYKKIYNRLTAKEDRLLRGEVAYKLGTCFQRLNRPVNAAAAYQNAIRYEYGDSTVYLNLGRMLQASGKYPQAISAYETYLQWQPDDKAARTGIRGCNIAIAQKEAPKSRYIVKQAKLFNTRRADFAPMYLDKNYDVLYFTTTNEKVTGDNKSEITGMKKGDVWMSKKDEKGAWQRPVPVEGELNTDADEGIVAFSPDAQIMYLTVARRSETSSTSVEIHTARRNEEGWGAAQKFEILNDTVTAVGHPSVSPDGKYLYFSSDMPGGYGGLDIWRINLVDKVGSLENLGPEINSAGNESFPYVRTDSLIYFSSDGHAGYGGLDIFKARLNSTGDRWSIDNMGLPVNSQEMTSASRSARVNPAFSAATVAMPEATTTYIPSSFRILRSQYPDGWSTKMTNRCQTPSYASSAMMVPIRRRWRATTEASGSICGAVSNM